MPSIRHRLAVVGGVTGGVVGETVELSERIGVCQSLHSDRLPAFLLEILSVPAALPVFSKNTAARLNRHGQRDALVERTDDEGALSVPRASRDAHRIRVEDVAARLLNDVDDSAHPPGPGE
jgi:hypothetical protein